MKELPSTQPKHDNKKEYFDTEFITGIRCYSALAVFLIHCGGGGLRNLNTFLNKIVDFSKYGVISFFIVSAFTICMSINKKKGFFFKKYITKRVYRIFPLYYVILLFAYFFTDGVKYYNDLYNISNSLYSLFLHVTLLNIFDVRYLTNIIGVEWSIPIEFIYYFFIPFLFLAARKNIYSSLILLFISLLITLYSFQLLESFYLEGYEATSHHFSLEKYAFCFTLGVFMYVHWERVKIIYIPTILLLVHISILLFLIYFDIQKPEIYLPIWIAILMVLLKTKSILGHFIFENPVVLFLGKISYSIYLIHNLVIMYLPKFSFEPLNFLVPLLITLLLSTITYKLIEEPFINFAKNKKVNE